ncbi:MAG: LamG-like jellyroll fold domain-containing protein, partial [Roseibacillus sp.]
MNPNFPLGSARILIFAWSLLPFLAARADLVGWWTFDEVSGATAADSSSSGASHPGALVNGANFVGGGKFGGAVSLDGVDDIVRISDHADFEFDQSASFTVAFWFRTTWNFPNTRGFIGKGYELSPHVAGYFLIRAGSDEVPEFDSRETSSSTPRIKFDSNMSSGDLRDGNWHHIVAVKDVA